MVPSVKSTVSLALFACALLLSDSAVAQSSSNPLNGSAFSPSYFTPSMTFTPTTTFATANGGVATTIGGIGPSADPKSWSFTYTVPTATVPAVTNSGLFTKLASEGYNTATDHANLDPSSGHLQIVGAAAQISGYTAAVVASLFTGVVAVFAF